MTQIESVEPRNGALVRWAIPLAALALGAVAYGVASTVEADSLAQRIWVSSGSAIIGAGLISYAVAETVRWRQDRDAERDAHVAATRRFMSQLLALRNDVDTSRMLLQSHGTVKTYGDEIRNRIIPASAALHHLLDDVSLTTSLSASGEEGLKEGITALEDFLDGLIEEYRKHYLEFSHAQVISSRWQLHNASEIVKCGGYDPTKMPDEGDRARVNDSGPWESLIGDDRFATLRTLIDTEDFERRFGIQLAEVKKVLLAELAGPGSRPS